MVVYLLRSRVLIGAISVFVLLSLVSPAQAFWGRKQEKELSQPVSAAAPITPLKCKKSWLRANTCGDSKIKSAFKAPFKLLSTSHSNQASSVPYYFDQMPD
jgi:hypothetical protein